ncbi:polyphosphate polymerase domain-containing protein [Streptococcus merionis]|uniref:polyphosphate polymerase domain-containing protein n=1 Tax=Streptococcus merionis TaxID=400065 RepID=UPI0026EABE71|nr:polyphosphate polymerase domain-containing protein [Streptococcus merionis]
MLQEVLRQEKKYIITIEDYYRLSRQFEQFLHQDSHSQEDGYWIRSLYFDSLEDVDWHEKEDGVALRRKLRLRTYKGSSSAKLEMKQKQGANQKKRSLTLSQSEAEALIAGQFSVLLQHPTPFAAECYARLSTHCYRPKTIIDYRRKAFMTKENNIRITFDHSISVTESCFDLFSPTLLQYPVLDAGLVIMEVKYNGFLLSYLKELINQADASELSASKYCLGRAISKHYRF